jgi:hypothetical protein
MGYEYGIWLIYNGEELKTDHMGHVTVCCFMNKEEALKLYDELVENVGTDDDFTLNGQHQLYFSTFYKHDTNKMCSWGYSGKCNKWEDYKKICGKYECDFSSEPHTSIQYETSPTCLEPINFRTKKKKLECKLVCVDITSDFPIDWNVIS